MFAVVVALVGVLSFLFVSYGQRASQSANQPQQPARTFSPTSTSQPDLTIGWKVYDAGKFTIKYPTDWKAPSGKPGAHDYDTGFTIAFYSPDYRTPERGMFEEVLQGGRIEISIIAKQNTTDLNGWFNTYFYDPRSKSVLYIPQTVNVSLPIQGRNFTGFEFDASSKDQQVGQLFHAKLFAIGDTVYLFRAVFKQDPLEYSSTLNQMISTFAPKT